MGKIAPFLKNTELLSRFVRQVRVLKDTPALIQLIAADAGYLMVCQVIVENSHHRQPEIVRSLKAVCRIQGFEFQLLQEKLRPAAGALGLTVSSNAQLDYYNLLGVRSEAETAEIKKAFREKAYELHPDTGTKGAGDHEKFLGLKTAYQILSDPILRMHYDLSRQNLNQWHESPVQEPTTDGTTSTPTTFLPFVEKIDAVGRPM